MCALLSNFIFVTSAHTAHTYTITTADLIWHCILFVYFVFQLVSKLFFKKWFLLSLIACCSENIFLIEILNGYWRVIAPTITNGITEIMSSPSSQLPDSFAAPNIRNTFGVYQLSRQLGQLSKRAIEKNLILLQMLWVTSHPLLFILKSKIFVWKIMLHGSSSSKLPSNA